VRGMGNLTDVGVESRPDQEAVGRAGDGLLEAEQSPLLPDPVFPCGGQHLVLSQVLVREVERGCACVREPLCSFATHTRARAHRPSEELKVLGSWADSCGAPVGREKKSGVAITVVCPTVTARAGGNDRVSHHPCVIACVSCVGFGCGCDCGTYHETWCG
jgi:hypothetical protein